MNELTAHGRDTVAALAKRHDFSEAGVLAMLAALVQGGGGMAQFNHADFGGSGQWMRGGMTMVSDMFNHGLKARVDALCRELAELTEAEPTLPQPGNCQQLAQGQRTDAQPRSDNSLFTAAPSRASSAWWPPELPAPVSMGSQNGMQYAYFPQARRLALNIEGAVSVYDTGDHQIGGFSQQQSSSGTLSFASQHGPVDLASLKRLRGASVGAASAPRDRMRQSDRPTTWDRQPQSTDLLKVIEQLGGLREKGILTDDEFHIKKAELLARL